VGSLNIFVQSEAFHPDHVLKSINSFLSDFYYTKLKSDAFASNFNCLVDELRSFLSKTFGLFEYNDNLLWRSILSRKYSMFDLKYDVLNILSKISVEKFRNFYYKMILDKNSRKKLTMVMYGKDKETELDVDCNIKYEHINEYKHKRKYLCC